MAILSGLFPQDKIYISNPHGLGFERNNFVLAIVTNNFRKDV